MAASNEIPKKIPDLLELRFPRGKSRGRGGPASGLDASGGGSSESEKAIKDLVVQQTNQDACISRMSAVELGYLYDPFAREFATEGAPRRFPIINRGTYLRTRGIDTLVDAFISANPITPKQIISLGAGSDTRFFRLASSTPPPNILYHEIDFPTITASKIATITASSTLRAPLGDFSLILATDTELHSPSYHLHAIDLRSLSTNPSAKPSPGKLLYIDPALPTLLISECCLTYLPPAAADAVVQYFVQRVFPPNTPLGLVLYEPINPFDSFGKVMVANLAARGIILQTLHKYGSLEAQRERLRMYGFVSGSGVVDIDFLYEVWVEEGEKMRIARVEMLDEVEELNLLAKHYCVAWGWRDLVVENGKGKGDKGKREGNGGEKGVWEKWKTLRSQESGRD